MRLSLMLTAILAFSITAVVLLSSSDSIANAIVVNNTDFSVNVLDNWAYLKSNLFADAFGGSWLDLIPTEFSQFLVNPNKTITGDAIRNGGAYAILRIDSDYPYRNIPLDIYTQYQANQSKVKYSLRKIQPSTENPQ